MYFLRRLLLGRVVTYLTGMGAMRNNSSLSTMLINIFSTPLIYFTLALIKVATDFSEVLQHLLLSFPQHSNPTPKAPSPWKAL